MAVSVAGTTTPVNQNGSVTVPAGANRVTVWGYTSGYSVNGLISGSTIGGQATTIGARYPDTGGTDARAVAQMYLLEAIVAAFSGAQTCTATVTGTSNSNRGSVITLAGVDQTNPVVDFKQGALASGTSHQLPAITTEAGGVVLVLAAPGASALQGGPPISGYTVIHNETVASPLGAFMYKLIASGTSETPGAMTTGSAAITRYAMLSLRQATGGAANILSALLGPFGGPLQ